MTSARAQGSSGIRLPAAHASSSGKVAATFFACAVAVAANLELAAVMAASRHDVVCHGYRWEEVFRLTEDEEREHMRMAMASLTTSVGRRP